jgi:hypothetical protein
VEVNTRNHAVRLGFSDATPFAPQARLFIAQPTKIPGLGTYYPAAKFPVERDAFVVPLKKSATTWIELNPAD